MIDALSGVLNEGRDMVPLCGWVDSKPLCDLPPGAVAGELTTIEMNTRISHESGC